MTVQFVVGATPDTDRTILGKVTELYANRGIHHTHFAAFRPIRNTPLENVRATPAVHLKKVFEEKYDELVLVRGPRQAGERGG